MYPQNYIPQTQIYTIFSEKNPLRNIAMSFPTNMCWLTTLLYALEQMGFENNKKLHYKLSYMLSSSLGLLFINKEDGAMYFPKKYEVNDGYIKNSLNNIFRKTRLKTRVIKVLSDIKFEELVLIQKYLDDGKKLVTIVKNKHLTSNLAVVGEAANHAVLITALEDLQNGRVIVTFIDPSDGLSHRIEIGVNIFMQWIQYVWVMERKYSLLDKIFRKKTIV
jgi:hypothetical protein